MKERLRRPDATDLDAINRTIEAAVMAWPLAARVKRLAVPVLTYDTVDMENLEMLIDERDGSVAGIAAWCEHGGIEASSGRQILLHGLYVHPDLQGEGIGQALQQAVFAQARRDGMAGVVLRAERVSAGYFKKCGFAALPPSEEPGNAYPYRFWKPIAAA